MLKSITREGKYMKKKNFVLAVVALALILGLSFATVAVAQNITEQRNCYSAGCVNWQSCDKNANCPRVGTEARQCGTGNCCQR